MPNKPKPLSEELAAWFDNFSQSAAADMGREGGGHKKLYVAEQCILALSGYDPELYAKFKKATEHMKYDKVLKLVAPHVRTL